MERKLLGIALAVAVFGCSTKATTGADPGQPQASSPANEETATPEVGLSPVVSNSNSPAKISAGMARDAMLERLRTDTVDDLALHIETFDWIKKNVGYDQAIYPSEASAWVIVATGSFSKVTGDGAPYKFAMGVVAQDNAQILYFALSKSRPPYLDAIMAP